MPIYDYYCDSCDHSFDKLVRLADEDKPTACPKCQSPSKREIKAPSIHLNGCDSGFPRAWSQWEKKRRQKVAQEQKKREG